MVEDIRIFLILQKSKLSRFLKIFKEKDWPKILVMVCFLLVALILALTTYFFSKSAFLFINHYPQFLESMLFYTLLGWFFLIFILTLGSSLISALQNFFVQDDDRLLLSLPIKPQIIFESRLIDLITLSGWPVFVFGLPLLWAFKKSFQFSFCYFFLSFLALILVYLISVLIASIVSLKIISFTGQSGKKAVNLSVLIGLPILAWAATNVLIPANLVETFQKLELSQINRFLKLLPINSPFFPSTWAVNFIFYWTIKPEFAIDNLIKLFLLLTVLTGFLYWLVNKEYFYDLSKVRIGYFIARPQDKRRPSFNKKSFSYGLKSLKTTFLEKDLLIFSRNQAEIYQAGFIFFMILLYFLILDKIPLEKLAENLPYFSIEKLMGMNFIFGAYILALLGLRFVFPMMSSEGQAGWLLWSAPFSKKEIFWQKLLTGWGFLTLIGAIVSLFSTLILKLNFRLLTNQFLFFLPLALGLASINLGFGALFPDFREKNLEKISTSAGGILATALSLFYIFLFNQLLLFNFDKPFLSLFYLLIWLLSAGVAIFLSVISLFKIKRYQF